MIASVRRSAAVRHPAAGRRPATGRRPAAIRRTTAFVAAALLLAACGAATPAPTAVPEAATTPLPGSATELCVSNGGGVPDCGRPVAEWPAEVAASLPPDAAAGEGVTRGCAVLAPVAGGKPDDPKLFVGVSSANGKEAIPMPVGTVTCLAGADGAPLGRAVFLLGYQDGVSAEIRVRWWTPGIAEVAVTHSGEIRWSGAVAEGTPASFPLGAHTIGLEVLPELDGSPTLHVSVS